MRLRFGGLPFRLERGVLETVDIPSTTPVSLSRPFSLGVGFRVQGSGFRVQGLGFRVWCLGFRA